MGFRGLEGLGFEVSGFRVYRVFAPPNPFLG